MEDNSDTERVADNPDRQALIQTAVEWLRANSFRDIHARLSWMPKPGVIEGDESSQRFDFAATAPDGTKVVGDCPTGDLLLTRKYDDHRIDLLVELSGKTEVEPWFFVATESDTLRKWLERYRFRKGARLVKPYVRIVVVGGA
jgi:hypothetical protein